MKTIKKILYIALIGIFLSSCVSQKGNCGSKSDHKKRVYKTKKMAPRMVN